MNTPSRFQRIRNRKGWKMPEGAIYVGRPSVWGNPFEIDERGRGHAIDLFNRFVERSAEGTPLSVANIKRALRGKNLVCWCPLDKPCHADVLILIANS